LQLCKRFVSDLERDENLHWYISSDAKLFILYFKRGKHFVHNVRLSYFTIICNTHEYKKMDQGFGRGQWYDVHNEIKISKNTGWAYPFIMTKLWLYFPSLFVMD
jgi:hypothetical protein